jgi:hypothetical protein
MKRKQDDAMKDDRQRCKFRVIEGASRQLAVCSDQDEAVAVTTVISLADDPIYAATRKYIATANALNKAYDSFGGDDGSDEFYGRAENRTNVEPNLGAEYPNLGNSEQPANSLDRQCIFSASR